jgi:AcrR family transcriptional regulator
VTTDDDRHPRGRRAARQAETRRRIVEAAMRLHTTVGPARTSISAVAAAAGVQRHTVYAHFPDERSLFGACSHLWMELHPFPDVAAWAGVPDPGARLARALDELYAWYEAAGDELAVVFAGAHGVPAMDENLARWEAGLTGMTEVLMAGRGLRGRARARVGAVLRHVLQLPTWQGLGPAAGVRRHETVALATALVAAAAAPVPGGRGRAGVTAAPADPPGRAGPASTPAGARAGGGRASARARDAGG